MADKMKNEKIEYLTLKLKQTAAELSEQEAVLVDKIKTKKGEIEECQKRLLQMIDETQKIQRDIIEHNGAIKACGDMLYDLKPKNDGGKQ